MAWARLHDAHRYANGCLWLSLCAAAVGLSAAALLLRPMAELALRAAFATAAIVGSVRLRAIAHAGIIAPQGVGRTSWRKTTALLDASRVVTLITGR